jgi:hypothetical protein
LLGEANVLILGAPVAAGVQHDQHVCPLNEVNAAAPAVLDTRLRNAFANRLCIARVAERLASDSIVYARLCLSISKRVEPLLVLIGLADPDHGGSGSHGIRARTADDVFFEEGDQWRCPKMAACSGRQTAGPRALSPILA